MKSNKRFVVTFGLFILMTISSYCSYAESQYPSALSMDDPLVAELISRPAMGKHALVPEGLEGILEVLEELSCESNFLTFNRYSCAQIKIPSHDGVLLDATIYVPSQLQRGGYPTVVSATGYGANHHLDHPIRSRVLATAGYLVLSYTARGFHESEGLVDIYGPETVQDGSAVIDWLQANYHIGKIATTGISQGGTLALLTAAKDPRVTAVASYSAPIDVGEALYPNHTKNELLFSVYSDNAPTIKKSEAIYSLLDTMDEIRIREAMNIRSPTNYLSDFERNGTAILLSHNYDDHLILVNPTIEFFQKLTVPKKLLLNAGTHGSAEAITEILNLKGYIWQSMFAWFDYHLKDNDNNVLDKPKVAMAHKLGINGIREEYDDWPVTANGTIYYLHPGGVSNFKQGKILSYPYFGSNIIKNFIAGSDTHATAKTLFFGLLLPGLDPGLDLFYDYPSWMKDRRHGISFMSKSLSRELAIRGKPVVDIWVTPHSHEIQLQVYLYDINRLGLGRIISNSPVTLHDAQPGVSQKVRVELSATSYNLARWNRLELVVDTEDPFFIKPENTAYEVSIPFGVESPLKANVSSFYIPHL